MASDFELDAMLEIDDSQVDDVNDDLEANVTGGGGEMGPAERDKQESVVAGGVSKGLLAAGVLAGILSQLKSVTGIVSAVLGAISRYLVPIVEEVADQIRPFLEGAQEAAAAPQQAIQNFQNTTLEDIVRGTTGVEGDADRITTEEAISGTQNAASGLVDLFFGTQNADQTGEATKQQAKDTVEDPKRDKLGG